MAMPVVQLTPEGLGTCRVPRSQYDRVLLGHGSGGLLTADLIQRLFVPGFGNDTLAALEDQATITLPSVVARSLDAVVARSPDRATTADRRSPPADEETFG